MRLIHENPASFDFKRAYSIEISTHPINPVQSQNR